MIEYFAKKNMPCYLTQNFYNTLKEICVEREDFLLSNKWDCQFFGEFPEIERLITFTYLNIEVIFLFF